MTSYFARVWSVFLLAIAGSAVHAEEAQTEALLNLNGGDENTETALNVSFDTRIDFQNVWYDGTTDDAASGFKGKYFMLRVDGSVMDGFVDYSWRQRLNRRKENTSAFDDTDWVWVRVNHKGWHISGGKEVVLVGSWEYDKNPVDVYTFSLFWDNLPCFEFGATVARDLGPNDNLAFQVTQSPWHTPEHNNMYAYNLLWTGHHGPYSALWSVNMMEYAPDRYINYIAFGNKLSFGRVWVTVDLINRAASHQVFLFRDFSLLSELSWRATDRWRFHMKYTFDNNHSGTGADLTVTDGTHLNMLGIGAEFNVLRRSTHNLRVHANAIYAWGRNSNPLDALQRRTAIADIGFRWRVDLLRVKSPKRF